MLAVFEAGERPVEIGRALGCDIVVDDPELAGRHFVVARRRGALVAYDVSPGSHRRAQVVPLDKPWPLGREYTIVRKIRRAKAQHGPRAEPSEEHTAALQETRPRGDGTLNLRVGRGVLERRYSVTDRPLAIGRAAGNDVVLDDSAVSAFHCRLEPAGHGVIVRDLGSRNGTFVHGVRVERAQLLDGVELRVGRTLLTLREDGGEDAERGPIVIARSREMRSVLAEARRLAPLRFPVLVCGETGVGKEGIAITIHACGPRREAPFVTLNAGGIASELVESELFGHERGAFTGAIAQHMGVFEQAHGGTLFLDEVGELPLPTQARLLRVLENGELRRVGSERGIRVDVRLVCATHRDLRAMVAAGSFRQDLFYRIARLVLELPPLRARVRDIPALAEHFLRDMAADVGLRELSKDGLRALRAYAWPGNVRELRNVLTHAAACSDGVVIEADAIVAAMARVGCAAPSTLALPNLREVLAAEGGNIAAAARVLGIPRTTLRDRLRAERGSSPEPLSGSS